MGFGSGYRYLQPDRSGTGRPGALLPGSMPSLSSLSEILKLRNHETKFVPSRWSIQWGGSGSRRGGSWGGGRRARMSDSVNLIYNTYEKSPINHWSNLTRMLTQVCKNPTMSNTKYLPYLVQCTSTSCAILKWFNERQLQTNKTILVTELQSPYALRAF